jgi:hypothetical protein
MNEDEKSASAGKQVGFGGVMSLKSSRSDKLHRILWDTIEATIEVQHNEVCREHIFSQKLTAPAANLAIEHLNVRLSILAPKHLYPTIRHVTTNPRLPMALPLYALSIPFSCFHATGHRENEAFHQSVGEAEDTVGRGLWYVIGLWFK